MKKHINELSLLKNLKRNSFLGLRNKRYVSFNDLCKLFNTATESKVFWGASCLARFFRGANFGSCFYFCLQVFGRYYLKYNIKYI